MKTETLEKANELKRKIDRLESIGKMLTDEYRKKNPNVHLGIAREEFAMHYLALGSDELNGKLLETVKKYVDESLPTLKKELEELS